MSEMNGTAAETELTPKVRIEHKVVPKKVRDSIKKARKGRILGKEYPYKRRMKTEEYEADIQLLHVELLKMQNWVEQSGERVVMLFEGRDAAGKGGTIKRFTGTPESSRCTYRGPRQANRVRTRSMVFPAVHQSITDPWRNRSVRSLMVQSCRGRTGYGVLHSNRTPHVFAAGSNDGTHADRRRDPSV